MLLKIAADVTYGPCSGRRADIRATDVIADGVSSMRFAVHRAGRPPPKVAVVSLAANVRNTLAAVAIAQDLVSATTPSSGRWPAFGGVGRRFQRFGVVTHQGARNLN